MAKWLQQLESFISGGSGVGSGGARRVKAFRLLILIGLIGAALLLAASLLNVKTVDPAQDPDFSPPHDEDVPQAEAFLPKEDKSNPFTDIETQFEGRLKDLLESMVGVGTTDVMVNVDSTEETIVQLNEKQMSEITDETDRNGARRHITNITKDGQVVLYDISGDGKQSPIIVKKLKPRIRGVIVVAKGAENGTVHKLIAEAVSRGLDVPIHRISVVPRKT
ncbi:stage III sporulation protein AG [Cohnella kolymensis]|uniref:Stage III sporulation protein AG n=1 Tax=Cohnella kolymensis TaxID=1590652 RepID=A0ABR5A024_9BACL|nr:stage III sporulation protein AG [Cohnella kolymensis]KIL34326.1 stage III sporulation protein AG [Cohnella kolymensis]